MKYTFEGGPRHGQQIEFSPNPDQFDTQIDGDRYVIRHDQILLLSNLPPAHPDLTADAANTVIRECHRLLDTLKIPMPSGELCNDPDCQSALYHRIKVLACAMLTKEPRWPIIEPAPTPFIHKGAELPERLRESLDEFARHGCPTGGFLRSVLQNDLQAAIACADPDSIRALPAVVGYVYNCLPANCWGSTEVVQAHIDRWLPRYREWAKSQAETVA